MDFRSEKFDLEDYCSEHTSKLNLCTEMISQAQCNETINFLLHVPFKNS